MLGEGHVLGEEHVLQLGEKLVLGEVMRTVSRGLPMVET